jgi:hypothetical protein
MDCAKLVGVAVVAAAWAFSARASAAETETGEEPKRTAAELAQQTLAATPTGVDAYTAFLGERGLGAAGIGNLTTGPGEGADLSGGVRLWGGFLQRITVQGEAAKDAKGRFAPSLAVAARLLGDRRKGWAVGLLGRYRTEGFSTIDGEVEGGILGSFARHRLHLDAGVLAGGGIEEKEYDGEGVLRFGYDLAQVLRVGFEGRVRRELGDGDENEAQMRPVGDAGEWDMFAGAQTSVAFDHFFGTLTFGPQKPRTTDQVGLMVQLVVGGVAF